MKIARKKTRRVMLGKVAIGGGAPVSIQSMTTTPTEDITATLAQCRRLRDAGCEIFRVAVPTDEAARATGAIVGGCSIPVVADIHFDHRLALEALDAGVQGLRINPGTIGNEEALRRVARAAARCRAPVRVGVNAGSLEKDLLERHGGPTPRALAESAIRGVRKMIDAGCEMLTVSVKSSSVMETIEAYELVSRSLDHPLHVGVTEAGPLLASSVRSSLGIGTLLMKGIGDTIRVSVTGDPVQEVRIAREILQTLGLRSFGPTVISCPTCGRCRINVAGIAEEVSRQLIHFTAPLKVAIMGCSVNGPGEARNADIGIAGGEGAGVLFRKGTIIRKVSEGEMVSVLMEEIRELNSKY